MGTFTSLPYYIYTFIQRRIFFFVHEKIKNLIMDAAIYSLMLVLAASRLDGTKVLVSIPEGETDAQHSKILEAIANASIEEKKDWSELKSELKAMKDILNEVINSSALKLKAKPASTSEPAVDSSSQPPNHSGEVIVDQGEVGASSSYDNYFTSGDAFRAGSGWANEQNQFPAIIWKRYGKAHRLQKIGFRAVVYPKNLPNVFEVVGANNCASDREAHWTSMLRVDNGGGFTKRNEFKSFIIPVENRHPYRCLGLRWPTKEGSNSNFVQISKITMWEDK